MNGRLFSQNPHKGGRSHTKGTRSEEARLPEKEEHVRNTSRLWASFVCSVNVYAAEVLFVGFEFDLLGA